MALSVDFTIQQTEGVPSIVSLEDTSTGSDGTITQRRVYIQKADGEYLVEDGTTTEYELWDIADDTIDLDVLDKDYGVELVVQWLNVSNAVVYDKTYKIGLTLYNETYDYGLSQLLTGNPLLINDGNFFEKKSQLRTLIDSGNQAVNYGDLLNAQLCYDAATILRTQSPYSF